MTKVEIIDMVANHFHLYNRGIGHNGCEYRTNDGMMCAVGMCMIDEALDKYGEFTGNVESIAKSLTKIGMERSIDVLLKDEYKGHDLEFWSELQYFHDREILWDTKGLSERGLNHYKKLKSFYNEQ